MLSWVGGSRITSWNHRFATCLGLGPHAGSDETWVGVWRGTRVCSSPSGSRSGYRLNLLENWMTNAHTGTYRHMHRHTRTHAHAHNHSHSHAHMCTHTRTHKHSCAHVRARAPTHTHTHTHKHTDTTQEHEAIILNIYAITRDRQHSNAFQAQTQTDTNWIQQATPLQERPHRARGNLLFISMSSPWQQKN